MQQVGIKYYICNIVGQKMYNIKELNYCEVGLLAPYIYVPLKTEINLHFIYIHCLGKMQSIYRGADKSLT